MPRGFLLLSPRLCQVGQWDLGKESVVKIKATRGHVICTMTALRRLTNTARGSDISIQQLHRLAGNSAVPLTRCPSWVCVSRALPGSAEAELDFSLCGSLRADGRWCGGWEGTCAPQFQARSGGPAARPGGPLPSQQVLPGRRLVPD